MELQFAHNLCASGAMRSRGETGVEQEWKVNVSWHGFARGMGVAEQNRNGRSGSSKPIVQLLRCSRTCMRRAV